MRITGNTVLITGGASGIGFELARQLLALGNEVLITGRDAGKLASAEKQLPGVRGYRSDVGDAAAIRTLHEQVTREFPGLNMLVNNAGIMRKVDLQSGDADLTDLTREIETNLVGPIRMVTQFLPGLVAKPESAILNVSSGLAFVPLAVSPLYCAAKAGLHSYTRSLRAQLKRTNTRVFELAAPVTQTPMLEAFSAADMEGTPIMKTDEMIAVVIDALRRDHFEIMPGVSSRLRMMSRLAPGFIFNQLNRSVDAMLELRGKSGALLAS